MCFNGVTTVNLCFLVSWRFWLQYNNAQKGLEFLQFTENWITYQLMNKIFICITWVSGYGRLGLRASTHVHMYKQGQADV